MLCLFWYAEMTSKGCLCAADWTLRPDEEVGKAHYHNECAHPTSDCASGRLSAWAQHEAVAAITPACNDSVQAICFSQ